MVAGFLYRYPALLIAGLIAVILAGSNALISLPRLEDPVLGKRVGVVGTVYPVSGSAQVEEQVTIPIENALSSLEHVERVRSTSLKNVSNVVVELDDTKQIAPVWDKVRTELSKLENQLPDGCGVPELEVFPLKAYAAILSLSPATFRNEDFKRDLSSNRPEEWHRLRVAVDELKSQIAGIDGSEQVAVVGDVGEEVRVEILPEQLFSLGASAAMISGKISSVASGEASTFESVDQLSAIKLRFGPQDPVLLSDVASIRQTTTFQGREKALVDGVESIVLGVLVSDTIRIDAWAQELDDVLRDFENRNASIQVESLFSQADHVESRMQLLIRNLGMGAAAVVGVVVILMGWRNMLVVASTLPLSVLMVLAGMKVLDIPIHQMSVTGLIVALGLLIDNAIVMVEEVRMRRKHGRSPLSAINASIHHLALPLFGSTLTTALAFLPIAILSGPAGEFVGSIAVSVILAIVASLMLAMSVVPALVGMTGCRANPGWFSDGISNATIERMYKASLRYIFRAPIDGIILSLMLPLAGFLVSMHLPVQFFPPTDRAQIYIEVEKASRNGLDDVAASVQKVEEIVAGDSRIGRQSWFLGRSAPTFYYNVVPSRRGATSYAQAFLDVKSSQPTRALVRDLQQSIDASVSDCRCVVRQLEQGPPFDAPIEIRVVGPEADELTRIGDQIRRRLSQIRHVTQTRCDLSDVAPKIGWDMDPLVAERLQVTREDVAGFAYTTLNGAVAGQVVVDGQQLPVRVVVALGADSRLEKLAALPFVMRPSSVLPSGPVSFGRVAKPVMDSDYDRSTRLDGRHVNEIKAYLQAGILPSVVLDDFKSQFAKSGIELPDGYEIQFGGETEKRADAVGRLMANAFLLAAAMLVALFLVFRSIRSALIIAAVGGLSIGLGPFSLFLFGYPFGFMAIVGTMGLVGIAINDSIVVLAALRAECSANDNSDAVADVVFNCTRHIVTTTLTTIFGFLPLVVGGSEFWPPLAISIAGGVGGATLLALYFVPSLYLAIGKSSDRSVPKYLIRPSSFSDAEKRS